MDIILENDYCVFTLRYEPSTEYGHYIRIYSTIFEKVYQARDQYSDSKYNQDYGLLDIDKRRAIREKFSLVIEDENFTSKFKEKVDDKNN